MDEGRCRQLGKRRLQSTSMHKAPRAKVCTHSMGAWRERKKGGMWVKERRGGKLHIKKPWTGAICMLALARPTGEKWADLACLSAGLEATSVIIRWIRVSKSVGAAGLALSMSTSPLSSHVPQYPLFPPSLAYAVFPRATGRASTPCTINCICMPAHDSVASTRRFIRQPYALQKAVSRHRQHVVKTQGQNLAIHIHAFLALPALQPSHKAAPLCEFLSLLSSSALFVIAPLHPLSLSHRPRQASSAILVPPPHDYVGIHVHSLIHSSIWKTNFVKPRASSDALLALPCRR